MSKRNRLDRKKAREEELRRLNISSQSASKFVKREPIVLIVFKILALIPFAYSAVFYGGVTVIGVLNGAMTVSQEGALTKSSAYVMLCGILLMLLGVILSFFKKYVISFISNAVGVIMFLYVAYYKVIKFAADRVSSEGDTDLDQKYMLWYYPILIFLFLSLLCAVISVVIRIRRNKKSKWERDHAPVESILDLEPEHMKKEEPKL